MSLDPGEIDVVVMMMMMMISMMMMMLPLPHAWPHIGFCCPYFRNLQPLARPACDPLAAPPFLCGQSHSPCILIMPPTMRHALLCTNLLRPAFHRSGNISPDKTALCGQAQDPFGRTQLLPKSGFPGLTALNTTPTRNDFRYAAT